MRRPRSLSAPLHSGRLPSWARRRAARPALSGDGVPYSWDDVVPAPAVAAADDAWRRRSDAMLAEARAVLHRPFAPAVTWQPGA